MSDKNIERDFSVKERLGEIIPSEFWGIVPFALYKYQNALGLQIADIWFLVWLFMHEWDDRDPYPSLNYLHRQTGKSRSYLQTIAHRLHKRGLIAIQDRVHPSNARMANGYSLAPLKTILEDLIQQDIGSNWIKDRPELAKELIEAKEERRQKELSETDKTAEAGLLHDMAMKGYFPKGKLPIDWQLKLLDAQEGN